MSAEKDGPRNRPGGGDPATMKTPSASYSFTIRLQIANRPGMLGRVASAIGGAGGGLGAGGPRGAPPGGAARALTPQGARHRSTPQNQGPVRPPPGGPPG